MQEYTVVSARFLIEGLEPLEIDAATAEELGPAIASLEGLEEILTRLPADERREAISVVAFKTGETLWVPAVRNYRLSAGVAVDRDGLLAFAVGGRPDGTLALHYSARTAAAYALRGTRPPGPEIEAGGCSSDPEESLAVGSEDFLAETLRTSGWAVPVSRRVEGLSPELLARVATLSEDGVAHLFAEGGGVVLGMAGSTASDRKRAVERLPVSPVSPTTTRRVFGVLVDAGEVGSHYSEQEGWGLTVKAERGSPGRELEAAADEFRASRRGSLAVADSGAERRRIEANQKRLRAGFVSRRRRGEELVVRPARELDAARDGAREVHWTEEEWLRRRKERARGSGRSAYDTARAVYLRRLPTLAHRLLHLLRREGGAIRDREFVSRHSKLAGARAAEPGAVLVAVLRDLADAGKVRRLRSRGTGEAFLAATEPLDERGFRRSLNGLIRDPRVGIANPWAETDGVEPEGDEDEEALLSGDHEDVFPEETGRQALLDNLADEGAREEIEALTA